MTHKAEVLAYDREKRVYKDAYVDNFRRVRHFPSLAAIGSGHADGDSIILVQESSQASTASSPRTSALRAKLDDVPSRLMPTDPVEEMFPSTPPLTSFRTAVMCKHTKARQESGAASTTRNASSSMASTFVDGFGMSSRYGVGTEKPIFKPCSAVEAKTAIERKASYDSETYVNHPPLGRATIPPPGKPEWSYNNPVAAKEDVRSKLFFHLPPEGALKADRRYTQEFIQQRVNAYQLNRQHINKSRRELL